MALATDWNSGGSAQIPGYGTPSIRDLLNPLSGLTVAEAKAIIDPRSRVDGQPMRIAKEPWYWSAASALTGDDALVMTPTDAPSAGRFLRSPGQARILLPFTFATADGGVLLTVPTGCLLILKALWWVIGTTFAGGSSSALGVSSGKTGFTAKGSLLGGAAGDVAAMLATGASPTRGTPGHRAYVGASRLVRETLAVATAACTPSFVVEQLLYAKTIGTGAPAVKAADINGATPGTGHAAPNAGGTSIAFNAETTGTGTAEVWYLTNANPPSIENAIFKAGDTILLDRITSAFTSGAGSVAMDVDILQNDGA